VKEDLQDLNTTSKRKRHYIIRYSLEAMGEFILSFTTKEKKEDVSGKKQDSIKEKWSKEDGEESFKVEHWKVKNQEGRLLMNGNLYSSWKDLLQDIGFVE
jgi:hypothetical protein